MEKALRDWVQEDVLALIQAGRAEGPSLEYKRELWATTEKGNRNFLRDICSMANSSGGLVVVGVAERRDKSGSTGYPDPEATLGVQCDNPEQVLLTCESRILDTIDRRLSVESNAVPLTSGRYVLVFRVPNSLDKPHRVSYQGQVSFPARRERQIYELNASEIRDQVMRTASRIDKAENELLTVLQTETVGHEHPVLTVGVIPVFSQNFAVDFRSEAVIKAFAKFDPLAQSQSHWVQPEFSVDGLRKRVSGRDAFVNLTHFGTIRLSVKLNGTTRREERIFYPVGIDSYVRGFASKCRSVLEASGIGGPILLGVRLYSSLENQTMYGELDYNAHQVKPFDRIFPAVILDSGGQSVDQEIRPLCDLIHQTFGEPHSPSFDDTGQWVARTGI